MSILASPDPATVTTVAELARQLTLLRLTAPRPTPAHEPLTLRELSAITGIPRSTLGNAESGRILPGAKVVYAITEGCQVPENERELWTRARLRVAWNRRRRTVDTAPDQLERLPPPERAEYLAAQDVSEAARSLSAGMMPYAAAESLDEMGSDTAARLLDAEDPLMAVEHLQLMTPAAATAALARLTPDSAAKLLIRMPRDAASSLVSGLSGECTTALLAAATLPRSWAVEFLLNFDHERARSTLAALPVSRVTDLLAVMPAALASGLLMGLPRKRALAALGTLPAQVAATLLAEASDEATVGLLGDMPASQAGGLLAAMPTDRAAGIVQEMTETRREAVLAAIPAPGQGLHQAFLNLRAGLRTSHAVLRVPAPDVEVSRRIQNWAGRATR